MIESIESYYTGKKLTKHIKLLHSHTIHNDRQADRQKKNIQLLKHIEYFSTGNFFINF